MQYSKEVPTAAKYCNGNYSAAAADELRTLRESFQSAYAATQMHLHSSEVSGAGSSSAGSVDKWEQWEADF